VSRDPPPAAENYPSATWRRGFSVVGSASRPANARDANGTRPNRTARPASAKKHRPAPLPTASHDTSPPPRRTIVPRLGDKHVRPGEPSSLPIGLRLIKVERIRGQRRAARMAAQLVLPRQNQRYRYVGGHVVGGGQENNIRYDPYTNGSGRLLYEKRPRKAGATRAFVVRRHQTT
jgi:hypothetical protein